MNCETQDTITEWAEFTFGPVTDARVSFLRCADEVAEMARALCMPMLARVLEAAIYSERQVDFSEAPLTPSEKSKARIEGADVYITLCGVAEALCGDLHNTVDDKMAINRSRRWRLNGDGTGQHVKEGER